MRREDEDENDITNKGQADRINALIIRIEDEQNEGAQAVGRKEAVVGADNVSFVGGPSLTHNAHRCEHRESTKPKGRSKQRNQKHMPGHTNTKEKNAKPKHKASIRALTIRIVLLKR